MIPHTKNQPASPPEVLLSCNLALIVAAHPRSRYTNPMQSLCHRTISCRTKAGGDQYGQNLRSASYTLNNLNQYINRTVPGGFDMVGATNKDAANGRHFAAYDLNGNVTYLMNSDQTLGKHYTYDPYDNIHQSSGAAANSFCFSSKEYFSEYSLSYYGYRFYSSYLQRWMNRDPLADGGAQLLLFANRETRPRDPLDGAIGPNLYGFVGNDPVLYWDYMGLSFWDRVSNGVIGCLSEAVLGGLTGLIVGGIVGTVVAWNPVTGTATAIVGGAIGAIGGCVGGIVTGAIMPDPQPATAAKRGAVCGVVAGIIGGGMAGGLGPPPPANIPPIFRN